MYENGVEKLDSSVISSSLNYFPLFLFIIDVLIFRQVQKKVRRKQKFFILKMNIENIFMKTLFPFRLISLFIKKSIKNSFYTIYCYIKYKFYEYFLE